MVSEQYSSATTTAQEEIDHDFDCLLFDVRRSVRYHSKRAAFFGRTAKWCKSISLFAGFGTAASIIAENSKVLSSVLGVFVAVVSAFDLSFGLSDCERLHEDLKRRFIDFEKDLTLLGGDASTKSLSEMRSRRLAIEADEPTIVRTLDLICYNEQVKAQGSEMLAKLSWVRHLFCQIDLPFLSAEFVKNNDPLIQFPDRENH